MKGNRAAIAAVVAIVLLAAGWWLFRRSTAAEPIDLIAMFDQAVKRPDGPDIFTVMDATLNGDTKKAIAVAPVGGTRIIWKVMVPDDAWLRVSVGMHPDIWDKEGDGVKFLVGASDGRSWQELFTLTVNPFARPGERKWTPVLLDLSAYSGEEIEINFNTYAGEGNNPQDLRNDRPLWGDPQIVVR